jgi:CLIP-associating protein 1/2
MCLTNAGTPVQHVSPCHGRRWTTSRGSLKGQVRDFDRQGSRTRLAHLSMHLEDLEAKVQALAQLEQELAAPGFELPSSCAGPVVALLKTSLRSPNAHVSSAAVSCLAPLFPLLVPARPAAAQGEAGSPSDSPSVSVASFSHLKEALGLLAPAGVIDRTGDRQERIKDAAGRAFLAAARAAVAASPKFLPESPWSILERQVKEHGLANKGARVREQVSTAFFC